MEVIYYFHPCAQVSASWIPDRMLRAQLDLAEGLIATACSMHALCDAVKSKRKMLGHPQTVWLLQSVEHFEWVRVYFETVVKVYNRIHSTDFSFHEMMHSAVAIGHRFPRTRWTDPGIEFPPDCIRSTVMDSYRALFLATKVRGGPYKRVKPPYWVQERRSYALDLD